MSRKPPPKQTPPIPLGKNRLHPEPQSSFPKMTRNAWISTGLAVAVVLTLVVLLLTNRESGHGPAGATTATGVPSAVAETPVVRDSSHRLSTATTGDVTFVEFLDFECEACGALYPAVEELRKTYEGRVTFVIRYFPIPSHFNAERAARAVEAAAQQGKLEQMYRKMYDTQKTWGEAKTPMDERFRGFATELGLDMAKWDTAYNSPETLARINVDVADGQALGVTGTPTLFLNGVRLNPSSYQDLVDAFDAALT